MCLGNEEWEVKRLGALIQWEVKCGRICTGLLLCVISPTVCTVCQFVKGSAPFKAVDGSKYFKKISFHAKVALTPTL